MTKKIEDHEEHAGHKEQRRQEHSFFSIITGGVAVFFLMLSMVVAAPYVFMADTPPSDIAHPYTAQEAQGRDLYLSLGCFYCHSQFVRVQDWGIGNTSNSGDFSYDNPHSLGTERTGPDLQQIGGYRPTYWHYLHDRNPRTTSPESIMPNFAFLTDEQIDALIVYIQNQGTENLNITESATGTQSFHPVPPQGFVNLSNLYVPLMQLVNASYDYQGDTYSGDNATGDAWATLFDYAKTNYTQLCLPCHGCAGNGFGTYARHVVTQPANLHERLSTYFVGQAGEAYHIWRVSGGVPGTDMPNWGLRLNLTQIEQIAIYEMSFVNGSIRTIDGAVSDNEGDLFANTTLNSPPIAGSQADFERGQQLYSVYCLQCHGSDGGGDGPASNSTNGGYIHPTPANFTESGSDFTLYGRYVWKVRMGVETTNMPPWNNSLVNTEIYQTIFYIQTFSTQADYNSKWAPQYTDPFARNYYGGPSASAFGFDPNTISAQLLCIIAVSTSLAAFTWKKRRRILSTKPQRFPLNKNMRRWIR